jgi:5'(3')-deoxyribonucleotidase
MTHASDLSDKIVLAVDLDEVTYGYIPVIREFARKKGYPVTEDDNEFYSLMESGWFPDEETFRAVHGEAVDEGLYTWLRPLPGAVDTLRDLSSAGYEINIVTSRFVNPGQHYKVVSQTAEALERDRVPHSNLLFLKRKYLFKADAALDDSPANIVDLRNHDRFVITADMRYNRHLEGPRSHNWDEIRALLFKKFGR